MSSFMTSSIKGNCVKHVRYVLTLRFLQAQGLNVQLVNKYALYNTTKLSSYDEFPLTLINLLRE